MRHLGPAGAGRRIEGPQLKDLVVLVGGRAAEVPKHSSPLGKARFFFTPGVPREMRRMLDEQVIPRLLKVAGITGVTRLKRFHSFGIGESRADEMLAGIPGLAIDGDIKLGFQAHFPQLETKLAVRGIDEADLDRQLATIEPEVRKRLGNFVVAEDDSSLESVVLARLKETNQTLAIAETTTGGIVAARIAPLAGAESVFMQGVIAKDVSAATGGKLDITVHGNIINNVSLIGIKSQTQNPSFANSCDMMLLPASF